MNLLTWNTSRRFSSAFFSNPNVYPGGELIFGDIDSSKHSDTITYVNVTTPAYWQFNID